jgi:hypothetical protein
MRLAVALQMRQIATIEGHRSILMENLCRAVEIIYRNSISEPVGADALVRPGVRAPQPQRSPWRALLARPDGGVRAYVCLCRLVL